MFERLSKLNLVLEIFTIPAYRKITYIPIIFAMLRQMSKKYNIQLIASNSANLVKLFYRKLDPKPPANQAGMHEIPFQLNINELIYYIRLTKRKLSDRLKKCKKDIKYHKFSTTLSGLCNTNDIKSLYFDIYNNCYSTNKSLQNQVPRIAVNNNNY